MADQPPDSDLIKQVVAMGSELDKRAAKARRLDGYFTGEYPLPRAIVAAKVTRAYQMLMALATTNYGKLVVKAATSRMQVGGVRSSDHAVDDAVWGVWQENRLDAESRLAHDSALTHGRVFALVWPDDDQGVDVTIEDSSTMIVEYREGSRSVSVAALRRWMDDAGVPYATLYRPEGVYKFVGPKNASGSGGTQWGRRLVDGEVWPLANPGVDADGRPAIPVIEISTNRRLRPGRYGSACGDFEPVTGLLDRINVLQFLRLVIAFTSGFPIRAVIGDKIIRDDDDQPIAPFKLAADVIAQFEDPQVKIVEIAAADLKSFGDALDRDVEELAGVTMTPAYYLRSVPIQNVSADAIRASDAPLNARLEDHKPSLGEGWEATLRVAGAMLGSPVALSERAELMWVNRESRSLSERADAATKLATIMPWQAVAEIAFDATQEEIARWESMRASDVLSGLLTTSPTPTPAPIPTLNGGGA